MHFKCNMSQGPQETEMDIEIFILLLQSPSPLASWEILNAVRVLWQDRRHSDVEVCLYSIGTFVWTWCLHCVFHHRQKTVSKTLWELFYKDNKITLIILSQTGLVTAALLAVSIKQVHFLLFICLIFPVKKKIS